MLRRYIFGLLNYSFERLTSLRPDLVLVGYVDNAIPYTLGLFCQVPPDSFCPGNSRPNWDPGTCWTILLTGAWRLFGELLSVLWLLLRFWTTSCPRPRDYLRRFRDGLQPYEAFFDAYEDTGLRNASSAADAARRLAVYIGKAVRFFTKGRRTSLRDMGKWDEIKDRAFSARTGPLEFAQWNVSGSRIFAFQSFCLLSAPR